MPFTEKLKELNACSEAVKWCESYSTLQEAWDVCERGEWSLWLVGKLSGEPGSEKRKRLVLCACECARLSLQFVSKGEERALKAIETAEKWADGDNSVSLQDIRNAADAANAAADAANAAADAADAAYAAADAADASVKKQTLKQCADIVRKHYPKAPEI